MQTQEKIFLCFYKIFFLQKEKNTLFYMALIKRKILTSLEVLYTKLVRESVLFCKKDAFQNTEFSHLKCQLKVSSRVKNHLFSKFSMFRWLSRAHQKLSFKKNSREKCFFCADLWSAKVFSMLIILIDRWQVLSYLICMPLLNQANHAIWQQSWSTSIVLTVLPWILEVNASKEEKIACPFLPSTPRRKKTTK